MPELVILGLRLIRRLLVDQLQDRRLRHVRQARFQLAFVRIQLVVRDLRPGPGAGVCGAAGGCG